MDKDLKIKPRFRGIGKRGQGITGTYSYDPINHQVIKIKGTASVKKIPIWARDTDGERANEAYRRRFQEDV